MAVAMDKYELVPVPSWFQMYAVATPALCVQE